MLGERQGAFPKSFVKTHEIDKGGRPLPPPAPTVHPYPKRAPFVYNAAEWTGDGTGPGKADLVFFELKESLTTGAAAELLSGIGHLDAEAMMRLELARSQRQRSEETHRVALYRQQQQQQQPQGAAPDSAAGS